MFGQVSPLLLQYDNLLHHVDEHAALEQWLPCIILKAHDHDLHAEALLCVADTVNEVAISREQSNALNVRAECVIYQVNRDRYVYLRLYLPLYLLLTPATTLR